MSRAGQRRCKFFHQNGTCKKGDECQFSHMQLDSDTYGPSQGGGWGQSRQRGAHGGTRYQRGGQQGGGQKRAAAAQVGGRETSFFITHELYKVFDANGDGSLSLSEVEDILSLASSLYQRIDDEKKWQCARAKFESTVKFQGDHVPYDIFSHTVQGPDVKDFFQPLMMVGDIFVKFKKPSGHELSCEGLERFLLEQFKRVELESELLKHIDDLKASATRDGTGKIDLSFNDFVSFMSKNPELMNGEATSSELNQVLDRAPMNAGFSRSSAAIISFRPGNPAEKALLDLFKRLDKNNNNFLEKEELVLLVREERHRPSATTPTRDCCLRVVLTLSIACTGVSRGFPGEPTRDDDDQRPVRQRSGRSSAAASHPPHLFRPTFSSGFNRTG
jgi:hypothetical protein